MKTYIAVDSANHWLAFGSFASSQDCFEQAKHAEDFDPDFTVYVYEVKKGVVFEPSGNTENVSF